MRGFTTTSPIAAQLPVCQRGRHEPEGQPSANNGRELSESQHGDSWYRCPSNNSCDGVGYIGRFEFGDFILREFHIKGVFGILQMLQFRGPHDRRGDYGLRKQPRKGDLGVGNSTARCDPIDGIHNLPIDLFGCATDEGCMACLESSRRHRDLVIRSSRDAARLRQSPARSSGAERA